jgi:glutamate decarboxylase
MYKPSVLRSKEFPVTGTDPMELEQEFDEKFSSDIDPIRNLGTYSTPVMDKNVFNIMQKYVNKNSIDSRSYRSLETIRKDLISMVSLLLNLDDPYGEVMSGSSESIFISLLAHKFMWIERHGRPRKKLNMVTGYNVHNCFNKFAKFFDVDIRKVELNNKYEINTDIVESYIDDHTFCIVGVVCSTETGSLDDIAQLGKIAGKHDIPLHVDAASGGFFLPFVRSDIIFDFRLNSVKSMNISGHKYGLIYPGIGIALIRRESVPYKLKSKITYLASGPLTHINLLCTQNSSFMVGWYYNIKRFGFRGYRKIMRDLKTKAEYLRSEIERIRGIQLASHSLFPVVAITSKHIKQISRYLKERHWIQNPYKVASTDTEIIRIVVKPGMEDALLKELVNDLRRAGTVCLKNASVSDDAKNVVCEKNTRRPWGGHRLPKDGRTGSVPMHMPIIRRTA